eukprot:PLAT1615.2.p1 GENE.PLAT1615.2~~PLAT1615.2.p1  ORF type:complete len:280 (-),score=116.50 PLAT1615.2:777-1616(-)
MTAPTTIATIAPFANMAAARTAVLGVIPARYASSRFPGKPLALLGGMPVIQRTWLAAKAASLLDEVVVATDDERIFDCVRGFGGQVVMTREDCPTGTDRVGEALELLKEEALGAALAREWDVVVNIQGDEPMVEPAAIDAVVRVLNESEDAVMGTLAAPLTDEALARSASVVKTVLDSEGYALYFSRGLIPSSKTGDFCPEKHTYLRHIGLYSFRSAFLPRYCALQPTPLQLAEDLEQLKVLENGLRIKVAIVEDSSHGVDTPEQLAALESALGDAKEL